MQFQYANFDQVFDDIGQFKKNQVFLYIIINIVVIIPGMRW